MKLNNSHSAYITFVIDLQLPLRLSVEVISAYVANLYMPTWQEDYIFIVNPASEALGINCLTSELLLLICAV